MKGASISARRIAAQQLAGSRFESAVAVVEWMGAVQAQDFGGSRWALGVRLREDAAAREADIAKAIDAGAIVRTHALRSTWQLVSAADARWILTITAPRQAAITERRHRNLGIDAATLRRSDRALDRALRGARDLTREEVSRALARAGVAQPTGVRLAHLLAHAEVEAIVVSGAMRGKQITWASFDERVGRKRGATVDRGEAIGRLAERYFRSRGPATLHDFTWWSGLTVGEARAGIEAAEAALVRETIEGRAYWRGDGGADARAPAPALLLPAFDELLLAYRDRSHSLDPIHGRRLNAGGGLLAPSAVVGGRVVGVWRRTLVGASGVAIDVDYFERPTRAQRDALRTAAARHAAFLGREPIAEP